MPNARVEVGESAFLETFVSANYAEMRRWALQITSFDESLSDDILHDVYLKLHGRQLDESTASIADPNGYLYVSLRNRYRSLMRNDQGRLEFHSLQDDLSLAVDHKSLRYDPEPAIRAGAELLSIGKYLCVRKRSSLAACMAILKFFHGYQTDEISKVTNRAPNAVEARISKARHELQAHRVGDTFFNADEQKKARVTAPAHLQSYEDVFSEVRWMVFQSCTGRCVEASQLWRLYRKGSGRPDRDELAHVVSCAKCLDLINTTLRLPKLSERHPLDHIRSDSTKSVLITIPRAS